MAFTGKLGTADSLAGYSLVPGSLSLESSEILEDVSSSLSLTQTVGLNVSVSANASSSLSLTQTARGFAGRVDASSTLSLSQGVVLARPVEKSASVTISLTQAAGAAGPKEASATTTLSVTQAASGVSLIAFGVSTLSLTDTAAAGAPKSKSASSTLAVTSTAVATRAYTASASSSLSLTSTSRSNIRYVSATSELTLTQGVVVRYPYRRSVEHDLIEYTEVVDPDTFEVTVVETGLSQTAYPGLNGTRPLSNTIGLGSTAHASVIKAGAIARDASSTLSLSQTATSDTVVEGVSTLALTQTASAAVSGTPTVSSLNLTQSVAVVVVYGNRTGSNTLTLTQAAAYVLEADLCNYKPYIGSNDDPNAPDPPPATYTAAGVTPGFRLQYPATGTVTDELIISPNLGNRDRLSMTRINRETRGGSLIIYADPLWPKVETLVLSFSGLSRTESQNLLSFIENHLGEEIRLIDYEDRLWQGVITVVQDPVVQDSRKSFTGSFEFEGTKV